MDEVSLTFDIPMSKAKDLYGESSITIQTTGHEKSSLTLVLGCTTTGKKLTPFIIFKRKTVVKEKLPSCVFVHQNEKGWMDYDVMSIPSLHLMFVLIQTLRVSLSHM